MNAEAYESWFEKKLCRNLQPNSVIVIDNASYHSRHCPDYPISTWKKNELSNWLKDKGISFPQKALRAELQTLVKQHRDIHGRKIIDEIAKKSGHEVLRLPPYHCELDATELLWANLKILSQKKSPPAIWKLAKSLFRERKSVLTSEFCGRCVEPRGGGGNLPRFWVGMCPGRTKK